MWIWILATALADDLNFSPDRPGLGDSTGVVGTGHGMIEGGVSTQLAGGAAFTSIGAMGRIGVHQLLEARVRVPSLDIASGIGAASGVGAGALGLGVKGAANLSEELAVSIVPELLIGLRQGTGAEFTLGGNVTYAAGNVTPWGHLTLSSALSVLVGGGVGVNIGSGGVYGNAALNGGGGLVTGMVGGGGWLMVSDALQFDAGVDVLPGPGVTILNPLIGCSGGF